ncbi:MAG: major facilitator superfamily 1 [Solirubrobacteraceae bacterium]|nr:major facilitator superfamily 1 [Solirubrobacteraceae bacterium]
MTTRTAVRRLAAARLVSVTGNAASGVALAAVLYARTGSPTWIGAALFAGFAVPALASPFSGMLSDRVDRRRLLIASDLLGAACFAAMALASAPGVLLALAFAAALVASPFLPASAAMLPSVAGEADLAWANGRLSVARNVGFVVGPLVGGGLVALASGSLVFVVDAVSFLVSAGLIAGLRGAFSPARPEGHEHRRMGEGFRLLWAQPALRILTVGFVLVDAGNGLAMPAELPLAHVFGTGATGYGALATIWGVGGVLGARWAGRLLSRREEPPVLAAAGFALAVAFTAMALAPWFAVALVGSALGGAAMSVTGVGEDLLLQRRVADAVRGRVYAAHLAAVQTSLAAGLLGAGAAVDALGARGALGLAAGSAGLGVLVLALLLRRSGR